MVVETNWKVRGKQSMEDICGENLTGEEIGAETLYAIKPNQEE